MRTRNHSAAFTLLELVVVLAVLAVVTTLAVRSLDRVEDQRRYESAQRGMQELSDAILGSPDDRATDGSRTVSGFVADMGRLPRTVQVSLADDLELRELWASPGVAFDVRAAVVANGVEPEDEDIQVVVSGGWRGPYLQLPIGATTLLDGYGNRIMSPSGTSPPDPLGYARLRDAGDNPITSAGQEIRIVRILGANGHAEPTDSGYDRDEAIAFTDDKFRAALTGTVEVLDGSSPASPDPGKAVTVRLFGPNPANAAQIFAIRTTVKFLTNPITFSIPASSGATIGPRTVRAYLHTDGVPNEVSKRSAVKHVTLRAGANLLNLEIDR